MSEIMKEIIAQYLPILIEIILTALGGMAVSYLKKKIKNEETMQIIERVVKATEQIHKDIHGHDKLYSAEIKAKRLLANKGIELSDFELTNLIESVVHDMNVGILNRDSCQNNDEGGET